MTLTPTTFAADSDRFDCITNLSEETLLCKENISSVSRDHIIFSGEPKLLFSTSNTSACATDDCVETETYVQDVAAIVVADPNVDLTSSYLDDGSYDIGSSKWDGTYAVQITGRLYYELITVNGVQYVQIVRFTGTHTESSDPGINIVSQEVYMAQNGKTEYGPKTQTRTFYPTTGNFSCSRPTSWYRVIVAYASGVGATYTLTLERLLNDYTWDVSLNFPISL